ncbi:MAG TPA: hypothetical protein VK009_06730 [Chloroflexota bacterium]|nr:hypothetical protein [Chloroflexota bacterium]
MNLLLAVLQQIKSILPADVATWESAPLMCLAVKRLWIHAGNLAEAYRLESGLRKETEPWSELVPYRNLLAHVFPGDVSSTRVFTETHADIDRLIEVVQAAL